MADLAPLGFSVPPQSNYGGAFLSSVSGSRPQDQQKGQLQTALQQLQDAINSGNQKQYDLAVAALTGVINGQQTLGYGQLMGTLNGQPTLDAQKLSETGREFNIGQGQDLLKTAASLTGPKDYGDFMQETAGGKNLYQQALTGRPASSAPQGDMEPMDMYALLQKLGMGPGQGGAMPGATPPATTAAPGGGGDGPNASGDANDPQTAMDQLYAAIMGGLASRPSGMDVGGGGTDPNAVDYSQFPTMANPGDIAYAKSLGATGAYDPTGYASYMTSNGYTPSGTAAGTASDADLQNALLGWWSANRGSLGQGAAAYPDRPIQGTDASGRSVYYMPGSGSGFVNAAAYGAGAPGGWTNPVLEGSPPGHPHQNAMNINLGTVAPSAGSPATPASWLPAYIKTLQSLGPDANQGAAENLALLHQLGLDNPGGLSTIKNPTGNITPAYWDQLGQTGQTLLAQAAGKVFGWDPSDFLQQINAERPAGSATMPGSTGVQMAPLGSL